MSVRKLVMSGTVLLSLIAAGGWPPAASAQGSYPARPIRILVPFPAAGAADTIARSLGDRLAARMGQPVVVDNRPGAAGRLATEMLARSEPDGYTLLVGGVGPLAISPALYRKLPYDPEKSFLPITVVAEIINVMVVPASNSAAGPRQFIEGAKARRASLRFGSSGHGQFDHLIGESFRRATGLDLTHVPYKGGGPALIDMVSGDLQLMFATYVTAVPHVRGGRLRVIAVTTPKRQPLFADLPAMSEVLPGFGASNWNGMFAAAGTPANIAARLFGEFATAMQHPDVKKRQNAVGIEPGGSASREEFAKFIREDRARWAKIVRDAGVAVE